jgi:Zn-dependent oligopeptidase
VKTGDYKASRLSKNNEIRECEKQCGQLSRQLICDVIPAQEILAAEQSWSNGQQTEQTQPSQPQTTCSAASTAASSEPGMPQLSEDMQRAMQSILDPELRRLLWAAYAARSPDTGESAAPVATRATIPAQPAVKAKPP